MLGTNTSYRSPADAGFVDYLSFLSGIHSFFRQNNAPLQPVVVKGIAGAQSNGVDVAGDGNALVSYEDFFKNAYDLASKYHTNVGSKRQTGEDLFEQLVEKELVWKTTIYVVTSQGEKKPLEVNLRTYLGDSTSSKVGQFYYAYNRALVEGDIVFYAGHNRSMCDYDPSFLSQMAGSRLPQKKYRIVVANGCSTTRNFEKYVPPGLLATTDIVANGLTSKALNNEPLHFFTSLFSTDPLPWKTFLERMADGASSDPLRNVILAKGSTVDRTKPPAYTLSFQP